VLYVAGKGLRPRLKRGLNTMAKKKKLREQKTKKIDSLLKIQPGTSLSHICG